MLYGEVYGRVCVGEVCGWRRSGDAAATKDNIIERIGPSRLFLEEMLALLHTNMY
jgi:hypothetical protein